MPRATQTAVIVAVPAAEPAVASHRRTLDRSAPWGVPAHVSVLYPFLDPADVDEDVLWLAPEPDTGFRALTAAVFREFPQHPPYGGVFDDVVPHLTVGESALGTLEQLRAAETEVRRGLPVAARVAHALLIAGDEAQDSWRTLRRLPLRPRSERR